MTNNNDVETFVNLVSSNSCIKADKTFSDNIKSTKGFSLCSQDEIINNPNLICKKTNRGRKEKNKIPNDQLKCEVCLELSDCSNETLISCSNCDCFFHKSCYSQYEEITTSMTEDDEIRSWNIKKRDVSTWSEDDVNTVMRSYSYKYDKDTQKKVQEYFDYKYPGKQEYDASGKMIR